MKTFVWRHNRRFHSWSMMNEPNVHQSCYTDAIVIVQAASEEEALKLLAERDPQWLPDELRRLEPKVVAGDTPAVIFAAVSGD